MPTRAPLAALALLALAAAPAFAETGAFESTPQSLRSEELVDPGLLRGPGYALAETAEADGFALHFTIRSDEFGSFEAIGEYQLSLRLGEIRALRALAQIGTGEAYRAALVKAGKMPLTVGKALVTDPVETVGAVPKGIYRAGKKAVNWLGGDRRERAETENSATREAIGFSRRKRELAAKLDVDPYSSNPVLQEHLDRVAWASFAGGMTLSVAFAAVAIPPVVDVTYKLSGLQATTSALVTSMSGGDLHRRNREVLRGLGLDADAVERFLDNPHLSPFHKTAITVALEGLRGVAGLAQVIALGQRVASEPEAVRLQLTVQLAHAYHANVEPLEALVESSAPLLLRTRSGKLVAALPADRLLWTAWSSGLAAELEGAEAEARELWVSGCFSEPARRELGDRDLALHERALDRLAPEAAAP